MIALLAPPTEIAPPPTVVPLLLLLLPLLGSAPVALYVTAVFLSTTLLLPLPLLLSPCTAPASRARLLTSLGPCA